MKKFALACLLIGAVFVVPFAVSFAPSEGVLLTEKRNMNAFPEKPKKIRTGSVRRYFKDIEAWFSDRMPQREFFVMLAGKANALGGGGNFDFSKCIHGKDGWLFLGNNYAQTVDVLEGRWKPAQELFERQVEFYAELNRAARELGAELHVLVGPNKSSVYPEYLPPVIFPAEDRPAERLARALHEKGVSVFDPADFLRASKERGILYWRTDTHWNELGVKLVLEEWFRRIGQPDLPKTELRQEGVNSGDLVAIGGCYSLPLKEGDTFKLDFLEENKADISLLVIGDSFSGLPQKFFEKTYASVTCIHSNEVFKYGHGGDWLKKKVEGMERKPDLIFWIQVERDFVSKAHRERRKRSSNLQ